MTSFHRENIWFDLVGVIEHTQNLQKACNDIEIELLTEGFPHAGTPYFFLRALPSSCILMHMDEILKANVFFFISSVATVLITIALLMIFWHIWKLSKILHRLAEKIEHEADEYLEASEDLRERVTDHPVVRWILGTKKHSHRSKREN